MLREKLINKKIGSDKNFNWRSYEPVRLEGFSDAVFAFAVTLLVVSLEVPKTFDELLETMRGFLAFGICFSLLVWIWYNQYIYFRRYALNDGYVFTLNALLIFVILFYIYPLKFLFTFLANIPLGLIGWSKLENSYNMIRADQMPILMVIYSIGYLLVFFVLFLLYLHAYKKRNFLELSTSEIIVTKSEIQSSALNMGIALLSIFIVLIGGVAFASWGGWIYFLVGPTMAVNGSIMGKKAKRAIDINI
ncbi:MAG: TMEM175 family protein [Melioribacteraceae bacterium]